MFFLTFSSKCDDLILFLPLNSLEEVDGLLFKRFSIENIPEELVDDDSIFNDDDEAFETILQIFVLMYDPEENTFDNELSDDKNGRQVSRRLHGGKILRRKIKPRLPHSLVM